MDEFTADDLIDETALEEGTYTIMLNTAKGVRNLTLRRVVDFRTFEDAQEKARKFQQMTASNAASPEWRAFLPMSESLAELVAFLTTLAVYPQFTQIQALRWSRSNGPLAAMVLGRIKSEIGQSLMIPEVQRLDAAKNESGPNGSGETTSPSAATSTESITDASPKKSGKTLPTS